jgi:hypothetical protein
MEPVSRRQFFGQGAATAALLSPALAQADAPPLRLGMLGMWHAHADGIVSRVSENPGEFSLVGFHDPDPDVVAEKRKRWEPKIPGFRVFEKPEQLLAEKLDGGSSRGSSSTTSSWRGWPSKAAGRCCSKSPRG